MHSNSDVKPIASDHLPAEQSRHWLSVVRPVSLDHFPLEHLVQTRFDAPSPPDLPIEHAQNKRCSLDVESSEQEVP
jgi:hypothetical protein